MFIDLCSRFGGSVCLCVGWCACVCICEVVYLVAFVLCLLVGLDVCCAFGSIRVRLLLYLRVCRFVGWWVGVCCLCICVYLVFLIVFIFVQIVLSLLPPSCRAATGFEADSGSRNSDRGAYHPRGAFAPWVVVGSASWRVDLFLNFLMAHKQIIIK